MKSMQSRNSREIRPRPKGEYGTSGGRNGGAVSPRHCRPRFLFACPFWFAFFEESNDTLACVGGRGQFVEINLLRPSQPFVKVNRVPTRKWRAWHGKAQ